MTKLGCFCHIRSDLGRQTRHELRFGKQRSASCSLSLGFEVATSPSLKIETIDLQCRCDAGPNHRPDPLPLRIAVNFGSLCARQKRSSRRDTSNITSMRGSQAA